VVTGKKEDQDGANYIHRGIANRAFERRFGLADHIKVTGAGLKDGLLSIELVREIPEAMKARKIEISGGDQAQTLDAKQSDNPKQNIGQRRASKTLQDA
jgi:molecular chaperone IbpA